MRLNSILLDTNLLLLYVVGTASRDFIVKHKKLTAFTAQDYDTLVSIVSHAESVILTPNVLTETSNLAAYIAEPAKGLIFSMLNEIILRLNEEFVPSRNVSNRPEFVRLGLTDTSLIESASDKLTVITADLNLYCAILHKGNYAINFNHIRDLYL